jgi:hypothetical protein
MEEEGALVATWIRALEGLVSVVRSLMNRQRAGDSKRFPAIGKVA